jgi:hypothetical protein
MRAGTESFLKLQFGRSEGLVSPTFLSDDGGFSFLGAGAALPPTHADANAYRADVSIGASDFIESRRGDLRLYAQRVDGGYSSPGMTAFTDTDNIGGILGIPVTKKLNVTAKADWRGQKKALENRAAEVDVGYQLTKRWSLGAGVRNEDRGDASPVVPLTQEEGSRTDAGVKVGFDPKGRWRGYGFGQMTLAKTGERENNSRLGLGYAYRINEDFLFDGEVSHGNLGPAVKMGTSFQQTRTPVAISATPTRTNGVWRPERAQGQLISGVKSRLSDSSRRLPRDRFSTGTRRPACCKPGDEPRPLGSMELQRQLGARHLDQLANQCRNQAHGRWRSPRLRLREAPAIERDRVPIRRDRAARRDMDGQDDVAVQEQSAIPGNAGCATGCEVQPLLQR